MRLTKGDFEAETVYEADPVDQARRWQDEGATAVHVVDLDGARAGEPVQFDLVARIAGALDVPIQVGGGIRSFETARDYLAAGVGRVILGTLAVARPDDARALAGAHPGRVVLGLDLRDGRAATDGWTKALAPGERFLVDETSACFAAAIVTDIDRDGCLAGPNTDLYRRLIATSRIGIVASGGVSTLDDVRTLAGLGLAGMVIGKALYEGRFTLAGAIEAVGRATCREDPDSYTVGSFLPDDPEDL